MFVFEIRMRYIQMGDSCDMPKYHLSSYLEKYATKCLILFI